MLVMPAAWAASMIPAMGSPSAADRDDVSPLSEGTSGESSHSGRPTARSMVLPPAAATFWRVSSQLWVFDEVSSHPNDTARRRVSGFGGGGTAPPPLLFPPPPGVTGEGFRGLQ
nr:MAG TPA: hypothetical protein [Caudoviricetes sp.]